MKSGCPLCNDMGEVTQRSPRLMDATYPEDDQWKGDEHLEPCPVCMAESTKGEV